MRITDTISARRNTLLSFALFSCIQITLGFFLIMGKGSDGAQPSQNIKTPTFAFKQIDHTNFLFHKLKIASVNSAQTD
ncbi:MAG: hypothetical protein COA45_09010 [Zetaproteobacteria bacterium]|nr:MAG: hypothetical protein COA45_09010 [Zetaproteobacteria bacterium]